MYVDFFCGMYLCTVVTGAAEGIYHAGKGIFTGVQSIGMGIGNAVTGEKKKEKEKKENEKEKKKKKRKKCFFFLTYE